MGIWPLNREKIFLKIPTFDPSYPFEPGDNLFLSLFSSSSSLSLPAGDSSPSSPSNSSTLLPSTPVPLQSLSTTASTTSPPSPEASQPPAKCPALFPLSYSPNWARTPESEHFQTPPITPRTPQSLPTLGEVILASITSSSPSSRLQRQRILKILHAAQFSLVRKTLLIRMQEEQREEKGRKRKRQQDGSLGLKRIPDHGQDFATMADVQIRRQKLLVGEWKKVQKQVERLEKKNQNLEERVTKAK